MYWSVKTSRQSERDAAIREWVSIPDANLPSPWTCDWAKWPHWSDQRGLETLLPARYALGDEPLTPIMFDALTGLTAMFVSARENLFYIYSSDELVDRREPKWEEMLRFDGVFPSVEAFIEGADWNLMTEIFPVGEPLQQVPAAALG
jgi:hypothetical protein